MERNLFCLKASHFILPVVSLALVGAWNASQVKSIRALEENGADLREKISTARASMPDLASMSASGKTGGSGATARRKITDWKELADKLLAFEHGAGSTDLRSQMEIQQDLKNMTKDEMIAALDEIAGMDLSEEARGLLESSILESLIKQDPEYALKRFANRIEGDSNEISWQLATAFSDWAKKDLAGARQWFDEQIRNGAFDSKSLDGRSDTLVQFEAGLMESLIGSDPNAAAQRLAMLPEEQRREVLERLPFEKLSPAEQQAYTTMVRGLVPGDERQGSFAHIASQLVDDTGYGKVSAFLDSVQATEAERAAAAKQTADSQLEQLAEEGKVNRQSVDQLRAWLAQQSPGNVDSLTGKALAEAAQSGGEFTYEQASQLILQYQKSTGSDDVLIAFLEGYSAHSNLEQARHLADMISDEKRRAQILRKLK